MRNQILSLSLLLFVALSIIPAASTAAIDGDIWWDGVLHNQDNADHFSPQGTRVSHQNCWGRRVLYNQDVTLRIRANENDLSTVWLRVWQENLYENQIKPGENGPFRLQLDRESLEGTYRLWKVVIPAPNTVCRMWYRFYLIDDSGTAGYTWNQWQNPVPDSDDDIDTYEDHAQRDGGEGCMYDYPKSGTEGDAASAEVTNDFLIIFYENIPPTPVSQVSPGNGNILTSKPTFSWTSSTDPLPSSGLLYQLQVDNDSDFSSPVIDRNLKENSFTPATLADGNYYWRVRALDYDGNT
ncbi:MAG: hypothetical protein QXR87_07245, partial [Candidatus Hadarchaeales archaeon]